MRVHIHSTLPGGSGSPYRCRPRLSSRETSASSSSTTGLQLVVIEDHRDCLLSTHSGMVYEVVVGLMSRPGQIRHCPLPRAFNVQWH